MKWSWKLTRLAGIDVYVHLTFFLVLIWIGLSVWQQTANPVAVVQGIGFVIALFACVVMHEFGHALTARRFGIKTRRITLLPIGGVALMERMPRDPKQEILVALAGPAVNVVIALVLWLVLSAAGIGIPDLEKDPQLLFTSKEALAYNLLVINVILAVFNLLPAFPMDGGRVLRAAFAFSMPHHEATEKAAGVGQTLAVVMFVLGLLYSPILMLISVFIWLGAAGEAGAEKLEHALAGIRARDVMLTHFDVLHGGDTLAAAIDLSIHGGQKHFPVASADHYRVITHADLLVTVREHGGALRLDSLNLPELPTVDADTSAETLMKTLQDRRNPVCGVMENGKLAGLVTTDALMEWINLHSQTSRSF